MVREYLAFFFPTPSVLNAVCPSFLPYNFYHLLVLRSRTIFTLMRNVIIIARSTSLTTWCEVEDSAIWMHLCVMTAVRQTHLCAEM